MQQIKFVLWERYRAWWGAYQLNEEDPLLLDRMKAEEIFKKQDEKKEKLAKMSKSQLKRLERKKELQFRRRQLRREKTNVKEQEKEMQEAKDAQTLKEFQRLAAGGGPEAPKPSDI